MTFRGSIYVILAILLVTIISAFEDKETKIGKETPSGEAVSYTHLTLPTKA